jgi:NOL1/NOP2/fmu family ribosome biogenesis protein
MRYHELRKRESDNIKELLLDTYGFKMPKEWMLYYLGNFRVWVLFEDFFSLPLDKLNVEVMGFYLCYFDGKLLRLSIKGAQIVGSLADKNVLEITEREAEDLIRGFDVEKETGLSAEYIILKSPKGIIGVGKNHGHKVLCQIKKSRRVRNLNY